MEEATHAAWIIVGIEVIYRTFRCLTSYEEKSWINLTPPVNPSFTLFIPPGLIFMISYALCVIAIYADLKNINYFKTKELRYTLSFLHAVDGINALGIGLGLYYGNDILFTIGVIFMVKCGLLYLLSRMVTGQASHDKYQMLIQTTKTYLHHVGSFLFLSDPTVTLLTTIWRCISMNGHAILTARDKLSPKTYDKYMWILTHMRNAVVIFIIIIILKDATIRRGFALSASGHIAYLLVRAGPVFRLGSLYLDDEFKKKWQEEYTDYQRANYLLSGKNFYFALEMGTMILAIIILFVLRILFLYDEMINNVCHFI